MHLVEVVMSVAPHQYTARRDPWSSSESSRHASRNAFRGVGRGLERWYLHILLDSSPVLIWVGMLLSVLPGMRRSLPRIAAVLCDEISCRHALICTVWHLWPFCVFFVQCHLGLFAFLQGGGVAHQQIVMVHGRRYVPLLLNGMPVGSWRRVVMNSPGGDLNNV